MAAPDAVPEPDADAPGRLAPVTAAPATVARVAPGGGPAPSEQAREDTDADWGEYPGSADDRLYQDRPPHWDDV